MPGYAGVQFLLLNYKQQLSNKQFEATEISDAYLNATKQSTSLSEAKDAEMAELDKDDVDYEDQVDEIDEKYNLELADIAEWETELEAQQKTCETQIEMLEGYVETWSQALQTNISKQHTYGPNAMG